MHQPITIEHKRNEFLSDSPGEAITPKNSTQVFHPNPLETFSLGDFVELLEIAGLMPTGNEAVLTAKELVTTPIQTDSECIDRLRKSRFGFLVEHLYSGEQLIRDASRKENPNDPVRSLHSSAVAGLINFLLMTRSLFFHILNLKCRGDRLGRSKVPIAEPGQDVYAYYIRTEPVAWCVDSEGRLASRQFREVDPSRALVERLLELLDRADPGRMRRCAFGKCGRAFYAKRLDQLCCSSRCNNNRLQREWYEEHGKSAVYVRASRREKKR
jgi:hypothetical protein